MRRRGEKTQPEGRDPSAPAVKDGAGNLVYKLKEERIVRRPIASPGNPNQSFWYNALLAHVATRAESDLNPPHNDFFLQCVLMGVFTTQEELDELINKYARYNLWDECRLNDLRRAVNSSALAAADPLGAADDGAAAAGYAPEVMLYLLAPFACPCSRGRPTLRVQAQSRATSIGATLQLQAGLAFVDDSHPPQAVRN